MFSLKKLHDVRLIKPTKEVKPGVFRGPASSSSYPPWPFTASPSPVFKISAEKDALYAHAYFGLLEPDLKIVSFLTAAAALKFFRLVEDRWSVLCDDIERGTLLAKLGVPDELRQQLQGHIRPDPARAAEVRKVMRNGCENVVQKLWPGCSVIKGSATGTYENSAKLLRQYIGDTPIYSPYHIASEALYGVCVNSRDSEPGVIEYTIIPQANFYEFIPEEDIAKEQPDTLLATEALPTMDAALVEADLVLCPVNTDTSTPALSLEFLATVILCL
ncbi:probable indole-3-acetic acid-amido synthetase GH3.6 [Haliotis rubra]|uniref:probable indole-3-acetic acid-amido synthetase GH3.6 n=1 Tax=Haliotis rubra TaxID=36100 RepID=UPI001EE5A0F9|nr:probable indole-3-acetic acid-amido synthetase GH3.6 [Haliotis rubra]